MHLASRSLRLAIGCAAIAVLGLGPASDARAGDPSAADAAAGLASDEREFVRWFDTLGYPDLGNLPFVRFAPAGRIRSAFDSDLSPSWDLGFLLADSGATFVVLTADLRTRTRARPPKGGASGVEATYEPLDLEATVAASLAARSARAPSADPFSLDGRLGPSGALALARACLSRGKTTSAGALFAAARAGRSTQDRTDEVPLDRWKRWTATDGLDAAVERMNDPGSTWADARAEFARWLGHAATAAQVAEAKDAVETLDPMIADERASASVPAAPPSPADGDAAARALVRRLRERGEAWIASRHRYGGWLYAEPRPDGPTAAEGLRAMGFAAVPALIDALSDRAFVRPLRLLPGPGVGPGRASLVAARTHEVAAELLLEISWGTLRPFEAGGRLTPDQARAWWRSVRGRTEADLAADAVARGDLEATERLVELAPDERAVRAIARGLDGADAEARYDRHQALRILARVPGPAAAALLARWGTDARDLADRVVATLSFARHGDADGWAMLEALWLERASAGVYAARPTWREFHRSDLETEMLATLVASGRADAYAALARSLPVLRLADRIGVLASFLPPGVLVADARSVEPLVTAGAVRPPSPLASAAGAALEELLGSRLGDDVRVDGLSLRYGDATLDANVGRTAAWALATWFPGRYACDPAASEADRDVARRRALETFGSRAPTPR